MVPDPVVIAARFLLVAFLLAAPAAAATPTGPVESADTATCGPGAESLSTRGAETANASMSVLVAPNESYDRLRNASEIRATKDHGRLTASTWNGTGVVTRGDTTADVTVFRIDLGERGSDFVDRLADPYLDSPTAEFLSIRDSGDVGFRAVQQGRMCPQELLVDPSVESDALRVVPDPAQDSVYVVVDTADAAFDYRVGQADPDRGPWRGSTFGVTFELRESSPSVDRRLVAETDFQILQRSAMLSRAGTAPVVAAPARNQTFGGRTNLAPGTELTVRIDLADGTTLTRTATVHDHGMQTLAARHYHADVDLSDVPDGTNVTITVLEGGVVRDRVGGVVRDRSASVDLGRVDPADGHAVVNSVRLSHGGFVVLRAGSVEGPVVGASDYLEPGTHEEIEVGVNETRLATLDAENRKVLVAVVHGDSDGDRRYEYPDRSLDPPYGEHVVSRERDPPYRDDGRPVSDVSATTSRTSTTEPSPDPSPTPSPTAPTSDTSPKGTTTSSSPTAATAPGFGLVVAIIALVATIVLVAVVRASIRRGP